MSLVEELFNNKHHVIFTSFIETQSKKHGYSVKDAKYEHTKLGDYVGFRATITTPDGKVFEDSLI